jgi:hypothetical protein
MRQQVKRRPIRAHEAQIVVLCIHEPQTTLVTLAKKFAVIPITALEQIPVGSIPKRQRQPKHSDNHHD